MMRNKNGFTIVELMIVIAIISIIAAISIPMLIRSKIAANESATIVTLKTIVNAQIAFTAAKMLDVNPPNGSGEYADTLLLLNQPPHGPPFLPDEGLASSNQKAGYVYDITLVDPETMFDVNADPLTPGTTGIIYFIVTEEGIVRFRYGGRAIRTDPTFS